MDDDLRGISGIKVGVSQIRLLQRLVYMKALSIHRIVACVYIVLNIRIGTTTTYGPFAGSDGNVPIRRCCCGGRCGIRRTLCGAPILVNLNGFSV